MEGHMSPHVCIYIVRHVRYTEHGTRLWVCHVAITLGYAELMLMLIRFAKTPKDNDDNKGDYLLVHGFGLVLEYSRRD